MGLFCNILAELQIPVTPVHQRGGADMSLSLREELISQIPALRLLMALGFRYLPPEETLALRGNGERESARHGVCGHRGVEQ